MRSATKRVELFCIQTFRSKCLVRLRYHTLFQLPAKQAPPSIEGGRGGGESTVIRPNRMSYLNDRNSLFTEIGQHNTLACPVFDLGGNVCGVDEFPVTYVAG